MKNGSTHPPKLIPHHNDTSKAPRRQPVEHPESDTPDGNQPGDNIGANDEIDHGDNADHGGDAVHGDDVVGDNALHSDDADDEDDENTEVKRRRPRTFNDDIRSSQLPFYSGTWVDVLLLAKNNYRLYIHKEDPFPERTAANLEDAHDCLMEAIGQFELRSRLPLDQSMFIRF